MGFFSWNCKDCGHPMLSPYAIDKVNAWMNDVVVLQDGGSMCMGEYDGYGRVGDNDIAFTNPECYHHACWVKAGKPTKYRVGSDSSDCQGFFFNAGDHDLQEPITGST